jgi:hypothetical protein
LRRGGRAGEHLERVDFDETPFALRARRARHLDARADEREPVLARLPEPALFEHVKDGRATCIHYRQQRRVALGHAVFRALQVGRGAVGHLRPVRPRPALSAADDHAFEFDQAALRGGVRSLNEQ